MNDSVEIPAPTAWPIVLAFGITLLFAGLVTSVAVSVLGAILAVAGAVGWFRNVLPFEAHEMVPVSKEVPLVTTTQRAGCTSGGRGGIAEGVSASRDLSRFSGGQGWFGRKRSDGAYCNALRIA